MLQAPCVQQHCYSLRPQLAPPVPLPKQAALLQPPGTRKQTTVKEMRRWQVQQKWYVKRQSIAQVHIVGKIIMECAK